MRIVAGDLGGRRLESPDWEGVRPATDRVRGAVFNILANRLALRGGSVLDLFAGTGSLGFEALSRGAARVVFVDSEPRAVRSIQRNARSLGVEDRCEIVEGDAVGFVRGSGEKHILVFADPPYNYKELAEMPEQILTALLPAGMLVVEHPVKMKFSAAILTRTYGGTAVSFFVPPGAAQRSQSS